VPSVAASSSSQQAVRTLVVWCPDWPVVAAHRGDAVPFGVGPDDPVAVLRANRVVACSASARAGGVARGMRRREAQSRVPSIELIADDPSRDARWFEPVVAALEHFTPLIEIVRPGLCQFATRGPSRYFGGDEALVAQVLQAITRVGVIAQIGIADGPFAAALASRTAAVHVVEPGESPAFLAPQPISSLISSGAERLGDARAHKRAGRTGAVHPDDLSELVEMWGLLGLRTLGLVAALPRPDVLARFGPLGLHAHALAAGQDTVPLDPTPIPANLAASIELDPPIDRVDAAAFVAKGLAEDLHQRLQDNGLACTRIRIEAHTGNGVQLVRLWRHERSGAAGGITAQGLADRVRWQLDGWLRRLDDELAKAKQLDSKHTNNKPTGDVHDPGPDPTADWDGSGRALVRIILAPDEIHADAGRQLGFWGGTTDADERAARVFTRIQGMLGPESVQVVAASGSRSVSEQVRLIPWGDDTTEPRRDGLEPATQRPWHGGLPTPLPTVVHSPPLPADLRTAEGWPVKVSRRGHIDQPPARISIAKSIMGSMGTSKQVQSWAGPWPVEEKWWDGASARRRARLQIVTTDGQAHVVALEGGDWWVEATYD
jgi:protein ImuB